LLHVGIVVALLEGTECWTQNSGLTRMIYCFEQNMTAACE